MNTNEEKQSLQEQGIDQLNKLAKGSPTPSWSLGVAAVLSALVAFILALGLDIGGITDKWFQSSTDIQMKEIQIKQTTVENELSTISVLQKTLNDSNVTIGALQHDISQLKELNYKLTVDNKNLEQNCSIVTLPTSTPTLNNTDAVQS